MNEPLINAETLLLHARAITTKPNYTKEDSARVDALIRIAETLNNRTIPKDTSEEFRAVDEVLRYGATRRDMGTGTVTQTTATSVLVHQLFLDRLTQALKAADALFDADVVSFYPTDTGAPVNVPAWDDTGNAATIVTEGGQDTLEEPTLQSLQLPAAPTFRTGILKLSIELLQDMGFPFVDELARAFAWRLDRGIGPVLVAQLLGQAPLGVTASGSSANTGGSETGGTSIGWADLVNTVKSVDPAYRASGAFWLMNDSTRTTINGVVTKQGTPMVVPQYDSAGRQVLLGYPIAICPSMDSIGLNKKPVAFGATRYFATRVVKSSNQVIRLNERFAEYGQVGFRSMLRCNGALRCASAAQVPIKVLQNASS